MEQQQKRVYVGFSTASYRRENVKITNAGFSGIRFKGEHKCTFWNYQRVLR